MLEYEEGCVEKFRRGLVCRSTCAGLRLVVDSKAARVSWRSITCIYAPGRCKQLFLAVGGRQMTGRIPQTENPHGNHAGRTSDLRLMKGVVTRDGTN